MKILPNRLVRNVLAIIIVSALAHTTYTTKTGLFGVSKVEAGTANPVSGYAWSETIGWISFSCANDSSCAASPYGVTVDSSTGDFSGHAWSETIGWINFAPTSGYPSAPLHGARLEASNTVTGWARACAGTVNGDCTGASRADGWDGWIKLSKDASDGGSSYGVIFAPATGIFSSYAWGSSVVGWIDFAPVVAGPNVVHMTPTPAPTFNFYSDPSSVSNNGTTVIHWNGITDATSCTPSGGSTGWSGVSIGIGGGSWTTGTLIAADSPYTFVLNCTGPGGSVPKIETVTVAAPICNSDAICGAGETVLNCPDDCKAKVIQF